MADPFILLLMVDQPIESGVAIVLLAVALHRMPRKAGSSR
jgi:ABC-type proline/glycine betaine transport system permease subunit